MYLTCVLFPLVRSAQPSFGQLSLKEMFSTLSNNNVFVETHISLISRGCCTNSTTDSARTTILCQKSATCIEYVQAMFDCPRIQRCILFKLPYFSRGELPTPKGVIRKIWFVVLEGLSNYDAFTRNMCNCEGHILRAYIYHASFFLKTFFEKGIACARGFIFDTEVD